jgi:hypothetical protein
VWNLGNQLQDRKKDKLMRAKSNPVSILASPGQLHLFDAVQALVDRTEEPAGDAMKIGRAACAVAGSQYTWPDYAAAMMQVYRSIEVA